MVIDCLGYSGPCACGQTHEMITRLAVIEAGCLFEFDRYMREQKIEGRRAAVYDSQTYEAVGSRRPDSAREIILPADGLLPNERAVSEVMQKLPADTEILIALGGGVIHEIVRFCAQKLGIPFVSCPTAASVDGFCAGTSTMIWQGEHSQAISASPVLVLADMDIVAAAPARLNISGVGVLLSKFITITDLQTSGHLTAKGVCPKAEALAWQAAIAAQGCCARIGQKDPSAVAQLLYGQVLSGLAMQMAGHGQMASGAAQQLADLMDEIPDAFGGKEGVLYGEKIGVLAAAVSGLYHHLASIEPIAPHIQDYSRMSRAFFTQRFGEKLGGRLFHENEADCLACVGHAELSSAWKRIRRDVACMPGQQAFTSLLEQAGAPSTPEEIGLSAEALPEMMQLAPYLHNRITLMRVMRMLSCRYPSSADTSRPPSRSRRYADKAIMRAGSSSAVSASFMR